MYGLKCDNCDYVTQSEDDHAVTEDGEYLCLSCLEKAKAKSLLKKWNDNSIQFPRLICELRANVAINEHDWQMLADSMDLKPSDIISLFDRADDEWEKIKKEATNV